MYKVLAIQGSPRKNGNTETLLKSVLEGARRTGADTELIELRNLRIEECTGCHVCWQGGQCMTQDAMGGLYPLIAAADALVFGTPVYWYGPTALMKAFLDRFVYFNCPENRERIRGKRVALVVPFEERDPAAPQPLVDMFEKSFEYLELQLVATLLAPGLGEIGDALKDPELLQRAEALGQRLVG